MNMFKSIINPNFSPEKEVRLIQHLSEQETAAVAGGFWCIGKSTKTISKNGTVTYTCEGAGG